jgi:hypothetical protein
MKRNSDGHQFHQYQQNEQSLLILIKLAEHKNRPRYMTLEIQVLAWDRHNNVVGLILLMWSQPSPFDNRISKGKTYTQKNV